MPALPQPTRDKAIPAGSSRNHDPQEIRYWSIQAVLDRLDGRLAREEYYTRLSSPGFPGHIRSEESLVKEERSCRSF